MEEMGPDLGPVPIAWWRFLLIGAMLVALYFGIRAVSTPHTHPALLVPALLLGGAVGLFAGRREAAVLRSPRELGHRGRGRRRAISKSTALSYVTGLAGFGLVLGQALSANAMEWMMLGGIGLMAGGAANAWVMTRLHEGVDTSLSD